jgi:hypothetical protein
MNLSQFQATIIQKLKENAASPRYWTLREMTDYVNRGIREFVRLTRCNIKRSDLVMSSQPGYFFLPDNCMDIIQVYWQTTPLGPVTPQWMDAYFSGLKNFAGVRAENDSISSGPDPFYNTTLNPEPFWDQTYGQDPQRYMLDQGMVRVFPIPTQTTTFKVSKQKGTLPANGTSITLSSPIPLDSAYSDLFLGGFYLHQNDFLIVDSVTINILQGAIPSDQTWELITYPSAITRTKQSGTIAAGQTNITGLQGVPTDQNYVDLYLNQVGQRRTEFYVPSDILLILNANTSGIPLDYEVVSYSASPLSGATFTRTKIPSAGVAGQSSIVIPIKYVMGANAVTLQENGISQDHGQWSETSTTVISLNAALTLNVDIEVAVFLLQTVTGVNMRHTAIPTPMVNASDVPDLPTGLQYFHDAGWQWALFECYSRESFTKDITLAQMYLKWFNQTVSEWRKRMGAPPLVRPQDAWRTF